MARWAIIGVESHVAWPRADTYVAFRGYRLLLRPGTAERLPSVAFEHPTTMSMEDALLTIRHYLSSLAWVERAGIREVGAIGGSGPFFVGRGPAHNVVTDRFRHDYLPDPEEERVRLALAFYREGLSAEALAYRFLSFFKIINILHADGPRQVAWINANLVGVRDGRGNQRINELRSSEGDVGRYLYESGRCAVAHAFAQPLVNPEKNDDVERLSKDLSVVQGLAEQLIEREFGVQSRFTVWEEHLYQLDGFRRLLGDDIIARLKAREAVRPEEVPRLPRMSIGVRDQVALPTLVGLVPEVVAVETGTVWLRCGAPSGVIQLLIGLAVADETLIFDPQEDVATSPEPGNEAQQARRDSLQLLRMLLLNGQLEIHDADSQERLGRTDAYVGQNVDVPASLKAIDRELAALVIDGGPEPIREPE